MSRDKQIDEMTKIIQNTWLPINHGNVTVGDRRIREDDAHRVAYDLYNAGYRKKSEIVEEMCRMLREDLRGLVDADYLQRLLTLYEKKYTEGENTKAIYKHRTPNGATYITTEPISAENEDTEGE